MTYATGPARGSRDPFPFRSHRTQLEVLRDQARKEVADQLVESTYRPSHGMQKLTKRTPRHPRVPSHRPARFVPTDLGSK